jgi:hypothetical protein
MGTPLETLAWYQKLKDLHNGLIALRGEYERLLVEQEQLRVERAAALATVRQELMTHMSNAPEDLE